MQACTPSPSVWQRLKNREITREDALKRLVDEQGTVNQSAIDAQLSARFLRSFLIAIHYRL